MTTILLAIFLTVVCIILSFLIIPFQLSLWFSKKDKSLQGDMKISWLGLTLIKRRIPSTKKTQKEEKKEKEKQKWDRERIEKVLSLFNESWPCMLQILHSLMDSIKIQEIRLNLQLGLESPADTAIVTGYIWAFTASTRYITPSIPDISIHPDFEKKILDGFLNLKLKIRLYRVTKELIRALTKKPVRSLISEMRG